MYAERLGGGETFSGLVIGIPAAISALALVPLLKYDKGQITSSAFSRTSLTKDPRKLQNPYQHLLFHRHRREPLSCPRLQGELSVPDPPRALDNGRLIHLFHVRQEVLFRSTNRRDSSEDNARCISRCGTRHWSLSRPLPWRSALQDRLRAQRRSPRFQRVHKSWMAHGRHLAFILGRRDILLRRCARSDHQDTINPHCQRNSASAASPATIDGVLSTTALPTHVFPGHRRKGGVCSRTEPVGCDHHYVLVRHDLFLYPRFVGGQHPHLRRLLRVVPRLLPVQIWKPHSHRWRNHLPSPPRQYICGEAGPGQGDPSHRLVHRHRRSRRVRSAPDQIFQSHHVRDPPGVLDVCRARIQPLDDVHVEPAK